MSRTPSFYSGGSLQADMVELTGPEAHHLLHVLRLKAGAGVILFDGDGTTAEGEVAAVSRHAASVRILHRRTEPPDERPAVTIAAAVPKGDRLRWMVEKLTELGAARWIPLKTVHSVVEPGGVKLDKLRHTVIAACKQSGRARLMHVEAVQNWADVVAAEFPRHRVLVADAGGIRLAEWTAAEKSSEAPVLACIGPEGGFSAEEIALARDAGAAIVTLGPHTLRTETAAAALAAWLLLQH